MSAVAIIVHSNAVHMLTDGAACGPDGIVVSPAVKAWPIPHLNMVIAARASSYGFLPMAAMFVGTLGRTFDECKSALVDRMRDQAAVAGDLPNFELYIAGVGDHCPDAFLLTNHADAGFAPWKIHPIEDLCCAPWDAAMRAEFQQRYSTAMIAQQLDPERDGRVIMEIMRRYPTMRLGDTRPGVYIGLSVTLTSVSAAGINQRIIHNWPDAIGEKIEPGLVGMLSMLGAA